MVFNSHVFVLFFALFYPVYRLLRGRARMAWLLGASYLFYAYWDWRFLSLLLFSTAIDYSCGRLLEDPQRKGRRAIVAVSVVANLSLLATFKYLGFFVQEANGLMQAFGIQRALPALQLALPIGLSFYTFQSMAHSIDVFRGRARATRSFLDFAAFVAFFPQLVAGPIERSQRLVPQLRKPCFDSQRMASGTQLILWGYFKKVFVADNLEVVAGPILDGGQPESAWTLLVAAWAFTWQIYCDFSGYTDIARGLGRWMGVELSLNFNLPFFADSPQDLWRRWHISLSQWLRDYLYIPLGGNRGPRWRVQLNLMITMLLGGLWHGANWTFVLWGFWHGLGLAIDRALRGRKPVGPGKPWLRVLAVVATFHFTALGFVIFRASNLARVGELFAALGRWSLPSSAELQLFMQFALVVSPLLVAEIFQYKMGDLELARRIPRPLQGALAVAGLLAIAILGASFGREFIYFQF